MLLFGVHCCAGNFRDNNCIVCMVDMELYTCNNGESIGLEQCLGSLIFMLCFYSYLGNLHILDFLWHKLLVSDPHRLQASTPYSEIDLFNE